MKNKSYAKFGIGCLFVLMDKVSRSITVADPGEGPGSPPYYWTKLRPEEKFFPDHPPPLSKGLDDLPPSYLRVWIRH